MFSRLFGIGRRRERRASAAEAEPEPVARRSGGPRRTSSASSQPAQRRASAPAAAGAPYRGPSSSSTFVAIPDSFETLSEVGAALRRRGLSRVALMLAVDFTQSNTWTGKHSFEGRCLHDTSAGCANQYERVISCLGRCLEPFLGASPVPVPAWGFGDTTTEDRAVFSFFEGGRPARGFAEALQRYRQLAGAVCLAGPTSFGPAIRAATAATLAGGNAFSLLVLIADGQVTRSCDVPAGELSAQERDTIDALVAASNSAALAVIMIGVGDGPWEHMRAFDDLVPSRKQDNFQFVEFNAIMRAVPRGGSAADAAFALACLQEVPLQYEAAQRLGLLHRQPTAPPPRVRILPPPVRERRESAPQQAKPPPHAPPPEQPAASSCSICLDAPRDAVLLPCGHAALCMGCAANVMRAGRRCPICRAAVASHHKLFLS